MVLTCCPLYHKILTTRKKTSLLKSSQISRRSNFFKLSLRFFPFLYHNYSRIWQKWWICLSHMKYLILHHWSSYKVPVNAATICSIIVDRTKQWRIPAAQKGARKIAGNVCTCIIVWLRMLCVTVTRYLSHKEYLTKLVEHTTLQRARNQDKTLRTCNQVVSLTQMSIIWS